MLKLARTLLASERLRHAVYASILAALVAATTILRPIDISLWSLQSKMFEHKPSDEIALVTVEKAESAKGVAADNEDLLRTLRDLDAAGAKRIVVDLPVRRSGSPEIDAQLRAELEQLGDRVILTKVVRQDFLESRAIAKSSRYFLDDMRVVSSDYQTDFLDFVWAIEPSYSDGHERIPHCGLS